MIDILLLVILGIVTWCVASEGAWGGRIYFRLCALGRPVGDELLRTSSHISDE